LQPRREETSVVERDLMMSKEEESWDKKEIAEGRKSEELKKELERLRVLISPSQGTPSAVGSPSEKSKRKPSLSDQELIDAINKAKLLVSQEEFEETRSKVRELVLKRVKRAKKS
jgi:hypothetical protein